MRKVLALAALLIAGSAFSLQAQVVVKSADDVSVTIKNTSRIITIGGSITETVYALGFGENVIGTDQSSSYPPQVFQLPRVPYVRTLSSEGILALGPTLILSSSDANPKTAVQQIRDAGTSMLLVDEIESLEGVNHKISVIGEALGASEKAKELITLNTAQFEIADSLRNTLSGKPTVMFVLAVQGGSSFMIAGDKTGAQQMIELAGGINAFYDFEGYKPATNEAILAANPDYILVMESRLEEISSGLKKTPGVNLVQAIRSDQVIGMDGNYLLGYGPRFGAAILDLMRRLHPDLTIDL